MHFNCHPQQGRFREYDSPEERRRRHRSRREPTLQLRREVCNYRHHDMLLFIQGIIAIYSLTTILCTTCSSLVSEVSFGSRSLVSAVSADTTSFPADASLVSTSRTDASSPRSLQDSPLKRTETAAFFIAVTEAIRENDLVKGGGKSRLVRWADVKRTMEQKNPDYIKWPVSKISDRYKYIKKEKKRMK